MTSSNLPPRRDPRLTVELDVLHSLRSHAKGTKRTMRSLVSEAVGLYLDRQVGTGIKGAHDQR